MNAETLREILNEYLSPARTLNWLELLFDALPSIVAIITVITTTIFQISNSKQETRRLIEQFEQQRKLEHIRYEEARKNVVHEFQLKHEEKLRSERLTEYSTLVNILYSAHLTGNLKQYVYSAYTKSVKLLSLCSPDEELFAAVQSMVTKFEDILSSGREISNQELNALKIVVQSIAAYLNAPYNFASPTSDRSEQPPQ